MRDPGDPFAAAAEHSGVVVTIALLVLVMGLSLALVPLVLFPVLRRVDKVLATGHLIMRGAVETACYVLLAAGWLLLVPLGEAMSSGPNAVLTLVFCLGATMFYLLLYRSRIVPRWIAVWGLVAIPVYVVADLLAMNAVIGANSSQQVLMFMPLAVQEKFHPGGQPARPAGPARSRRPAREPAEFGQKGQAVDNHDGIVLDHYVQAGNPPDTPHWPQPCGRSRPEPGGQPAPSPTTEGTATPPSINPGRPRVRNVVIPRKGRPVRIGIL